MSKKAWSIIIIVILAAIAGSVFWYKLPKSSQNTENHLLPSGSSENENQGTANTQKTVSDGIIKFDPQEDFGLAVTDEQILIDSYIPPCQPGFSYCLYYLGNKYQETNFDSAGLSIRKRGDLTIKDDCLTHLPAGYSNLSSQSESHAGYAISVFSPLGDAALGHYSNGREYRIFSANICYQLNASVSESQFANYPTGSVEEFSSTDREQMFGTLRSLIEDITLVQTGEKLFLPR